MSKGKEDYLKCIYSIRLQNEKVTNVLISKMLQVSKPAVTEMLRKLLNYNLIIKSNQFGYDLTAQGLSIVSTIIRKHRLIEVFLLNHLKYNIKDIHSEAEILEHTVSDLFIDKLDELLNFPKTCPHGQIIPQKNDVNINDTSISLSLALDNKSYLITRISHHLNLEKLLNDNLINTMVIINIKINDPINEKVIFQINNKEYVLSYDICDHIFVQKHD